MALHNSWIQVKSLGYDWTESIYDHLHFALQIPVHPALLYYQHQKLNPVSSIGVWLKASEASGSSITLYTTDLHFGQSSSSLFK